LKILDIIKFQLSFKKIKKINFHIDKFMIIFFSNRIRNISILIIWVFTPIFFQKNIFPNNKSIESSNQKSNLSNSNIKWEKVFFEKNYGKNNSSYPDIKWEKLIFKKKHNNENNEDAFFQNREIINYQKSSKHGRNYINSLNRSIVFDNLIVGPDISWIVPPGFKWNNKYKYDFSIRGHNRRTKGEDFFAWNDGDAVGQFYYQFLNNKKSSFGFNLGIRSIYQGSATGGSSLIGEGQSMGFRIDYKVSEDTGFAFGAEQLLHFDGLTDTGRDIYLTASKAFWKNNIKGYFPLDIYTFGVATGKMAEGNIKFLCSDLFGGSGTEVLHQRRLCWSPVFTISRLYNKRLSTFFEYNSKYFLLGSSFIPFNKIPFRGTFAVQLSDHIDNYKLKNFDELKWVFRLSLGF